jgi:DNA-binding LytR/AlgR family response regulator
MADTQLTAVVADDEPLTRAYLKRQLESQFVRVLGEADNAAEALQLVQEFVPDLLFLDIRMPGLTGVQCANALLQLDTITQIVFVTAYEEYALDAFEHGALDYLVKPVPPERLAATLVRARQRLNDVVARQQMAVNAARRAKSGVSIRRLPIREDYAVRLLRVDEIIYATAREKRVFVSAAGSEYRTFYTLAQLETLLPPEQFFRIHDAWLVNLDQIEELCFLGNHSYVVILTNRQQLPVSRYRYADLQRRLGIDEKR